MAIEIDIVDSLWRSPPEDSTVFPTSPLPKEPLRPRRGWQAQQLLGGRPLDYVRTGQRRGLLGVAQEAQQQKPRTTMFGTDSYWEFFK